MGKRMRGGRLIQTETRNLEIDEEGRGALLEEERVPVELQYLTCRVSAEPVQVQKDVTPKATRRTSGGYLYPANHRNMTGRQGVWSDGANRITKTKHASVSGAWVLVQLALPWGGRGWDPDRIKVENAASLTLHT